jgi:hypothetical protein
VLNVAGSDNNTIKHYFDSTEGKVIQRLVESYSFLIMGKSITEIDNMSTEYSKKFGSIDSGRTRTATTYKKN